LLKDSRV